MDSSKTLDISERLLELHLMIFNPEIYLPTYVRSVQDIYSYRTILKQLRCTNYTLTHLLDLIVPTIDQGKRFRVHECLRVIRAIIKNKSAETQLDPRILKQLFSLYKKYVFSSNESLRWCVSVFLKDQVLDDEAIEWLISHYYESEHIINRLLRYPLRHPKIVEWAQEMYRARYLADRESEVIALLIENEIPSLVKLAKPETLVRAIFYARISNELQRRLLKQQFSFDTLERILSIAMALGFSDVVEHMLLSCKKERELIDNQED